MKKRHVIFDFDGTITDSFGPCSKGLMETAKRLGMPADEKVLSLMAENYGLPTVELLNICWPRQKHEAFEQSILDANAQGHTPLFPGAENMLMRLDRAGIGMSIFTGRQKSGVLPVINDFGIAKFFAPVITRDDVAVGKPDPEGLKKIIDPLLAGGMAISDILFVGDNKADYACAQNAGVDFVAVTEAENVNRERFVALGLPEENILNFLRDLPDWLRI